MDMKLSICIPIFNEKDNIRPLYESLLRVLEGMSNDFEIIMVNDGSKDGSDKILDEVAAEDDRVRIIHFNSNYGQTSAMMAGIEHSTGEVIISMDGDNQNDPVDIPRLLEKIDEGYDVVSGWRKRRKDNFLSRAFLSRIANIIISLVGRVKLHDYGCSLKAYKKDVLKDIKLYGEMHRFIPLYASWVGASVTEVVVKHHARKFGKSNYGVTRIWPVVLDLILVRFLDRHWRNPFHLFGGFGLINILLSLIIFCLMIYYKYWGNTSFIETPLPILCVFFAFIGFMAILIGFMAEMLMRTYYESQKRHPYHIKRIVN